MNVSEEIADEQLVAFLDGALPDAEAAAIAARVDQDPALQARLATLDVDLGALRDGFDAMLDRAPAIPVPAPRRPRYLQLVACAAIFAVGLGSGWFARDQSVDAGWEQAVADYQTLYATETLTTAPLDAQARQVGLIAASAAIGWI